jgi:dephospho-CoA kinase
MTDGIARAVLLTGPVGSGKTVVAMELGELLAARDLPAAVVDLDWLGWFHGPPDAPSPDELIAENLRVVAARFLSAGARYLVLARALTTSEQVAALKEALQGVEMTVVLVQASAETIAERLGRRDAGDVLREHLEESAQMARALASANLHDAVLENETTPPADTARELLRRLGWA